jgi:hypothetical protein
VSFITEDFPGRSFETFEEYLRAKKDRERLVEELEDPKGLKVEISIEQETGESDSASG